MGRGPEPVQWAHMQLQLACGGGWLQFMKQRTFRTCLQPCGRQLEAKKKASSTHTVIQGKSLNLFEPQLSCLKGEYIICPDNHTGSGESRLMRQEMGKGFVDSEVLWSAFIIDFTTLSQPQTFTSKHVGKYSI